ncbi:restriction endonuclease subunit S [Treponema succinifaciens]|uniref:restriction endonuclease subunit S n=1 Tax=Treponema succinifaciens TaxID=167 RepID=UPI003F7D3E25
MEKLGKYCKIISGYAFKSNDLSEGTEIPVIKIGNISNGDDVITDSSTQYVSSDFLSIDEKYHIKKGDVLISLTGSHINQPNSMVGRSCRNFSDTEFLLNQRAGKVIPNENADKNYLYYLLNTESFKYSICNRAYGAANQANVSPSDIENIKWNFPALPTQQKIASILSAYDDLIQNYKKQIQALQTAASELYKEWFVRFRFPGYQNTKFENGIPEGWKVARLKDIAKDVGKTITKNEINYEKDVYIPIDCIPNHNMALTEVSDIENAESSLQRFESGDILFGAMRVYFHKVILAPMQGVTRKTCFVIHAKKDIFHNYLYSLLFSNTTINYANTISVGATMPYVRWNDFIRMQCLFPSEKILNDYNKIISPIFKTIMNSYKYLSNLTQQRDLLLPRLMSGKLEVK